ncbi:MAG TPA: ABC transporter permease, partial [Clostridia bacterium]|nr:ABC transporter permease [Clostridia bacterium]
MTTRRTNILLGELRESFVMAMAALTAHKLRSALTLLGVLVGVFSIIVVMTAMRVMQGDIEREISQLGSETFMVQKWPAIRFGPPEGNEKYWRRKDLTLAQGLLLEKRATLPVSVGLESVFWGGQIETRYKKTAPNVRLFGETPGSFRARNWLLQEGRLLLDTDVDNARDVCVLGNKLASTVFPQGSALGERVKIEGINYTVVGVLAPKGGSMGGDQDNFAVVPVSTGLNRFGRWNRSLTFLIQAPDQASYEDTVEQVRGILRVIRKVPPGVEDDFEIASNDSLIEQFNSFTVAVRVGVAVISSIALLAAGVGIMNIMLV